MWQTWKSLETPFWTLCCLQHHPAWPVWCWCQWWSEEAYPWRVTQTSTCLPNGTLTAVRYRDEILRPTVRPYAGAVGPGFLLVQDSARPHVARVCRQFLDDEGIDATDWPSRSPEPESDWETLARYVTVHLPPPSGATGCPEAHWCPDPGLGGDPPRTPSTISSGACPDVVGSAYRHVGAIHTTEPHNDLSVCDYNFRLWFSVWFWIQPSMGKWFCLPLTVLMSFFFSVNYPMHINEDFQLGITQDPTCDFKCSLNFFEQCRKSDAIMLLSWGLPCFIHCRIWKRQKVEGSESPAMCFICPWTRPADFTNEFYLPAEEVC